jgi:hypothetical protein
VVNSGSNHIAKVISDPPLFVRLNSFQAGLLVLLSSFASLVSLLALWLQGFLAADATMARSAFSAAVALGSLDVFP